MEIDEQLAQADLITCLRVAQQALRRARDLPLSGSVTDNALISSVQHLNALERQCVGQKMKLVAELSERQAHRGSHARSVEDLLASTLHLSRGEAKTQAGLAAGLTAVPKVAAALADGRLGVGQAQIAVRKVEQVKDRDDAAAVIAAVDDTASTVGQTLDRGRLGRVLDGTVARVAPGAVQSREQRAHARRGVWFDNSGDLPQLRATLSVEGYATIKAAVEALGAPDGEGDPRTVAQRHHDGLLTLAGRFLDAGELPQTAGQRPHVLLITTPGALHDRPGAEPSTIDGIGEISNELARQVCCDADITTVAQDGRGNVLNLGRNARTATTAQRKAVIARDRVCIGCGAPASRCEVHHVRWWTDGGPTDLSNLVLVCWNCHRHIHHHHWNITRDQWGAYRAHPPDVDPDAAPPPDRPPPQRAGQASGTAPQLALAHTG